MMMAPAIQPKTVLHVINTGGPGGAETVCLNIARHLNRAPWRSIAVVPDRGWIYRELISAGVETFVLQDNRRMDLPRYILELLNIVRRHRVGVIQAHLFGPTLAASLVGMIASVPAVCTLHGYGDLQPDERARRLKSWVVRHGAASVVFVSDALREFVLATGLLRPERARVIPNGIDVDGYNSASDAALRSEFGASKEQFLVGAVGNFRPAKNYEVFLRAAAILNSRDPSYRFVVIGQTAGQYGADMLSLRQALGLDDVMTFAGYRDDLARSLACLDLYALTSRDEGFSISIIEALASRLPVVATRCGGPEQIIHSGETGLLVAKGSPQAVADAIEKLRRDPETRRRIADAGHAMVRERFTISAQMQEYERLYTEYFSRCDFVKNESQHAAVVTTEAR
jgi:glycosyltransferase involved in cell wall biosynthesis